ncbi:MAG TPA: TIR domain-containing protein [Pyrinomonadaceae bacterium]
MEYFIDGSTGEWCEYDYDVVQREIYRLAGQPDLNAARALAREARSLIADKRLEMVSLISAAQTQRDDPFLSRLTGEIDEISVPNASNIVSGYIPRGQFISRDTVAIGQGFQSPPHLDVWADVMAIRVPGKVCETLSQISTKAAAHLARKDRQSAKMRASGDKVFIGHGRSVVWRDLKDFVQDRLGLSLDEFNRIPIAGITNIARLSQMLDEAAIAFIILTAEDELADGKLQARMNVVHEAGLFQGRLGFTRSIILLE